jgi:HK97 family phage major capsid protein
MSIKPGHRSGSIFMMPRTIVGDARKFKDSVNGAYIWQPGIQVGQPSSLLGYPIVENEDMAAMGAGNYVAAFGNFKTAFGIYDVGPGVRVLRDPYTAKPYVLFYTTKRVGSMLLDSEAVKVLKVSA